MHYLIDLEVRSLKLVCMQDCISFGDSEETQEDLPTCLFELLETAHIPWLRAPSSIFKTSSIFLPLKLLLQSIF